MIDQLALDDVKQDMVVYYILVDPKFLHQCLRKGLEPALFASDIRQKVVGFAYDFYTSFKAAPKHDIIEVVADRIATGAGISGDDQDTYGEYLNRVFSTDVNGTSPDYLLGLIDGFLKRRITHTALNNINKLPDKLKNDPDRLLDIMREAVNLADFAVGRQYVESILDEEITTINPLCTRFNIPEIDRALGGGFRGGDFAIIQAYTNIGKTWAMLHLAKHAARIGNSPLFIPVEASNKMARLRMRMCFTGMTKGELLSMDSHTSLSSVREQMEVSLVKGSDVLIVDDEEKATHVEDIAVFVEDAKDRHGKAVNLVLLDSADDMLPPRGSYNNVLEGTNAKYTWLKNYAKDNDMCIITTVQSKAEGEKKYWLSSGTVGEGYVKAKKATIGISINATPDEVEKNLFRFYLFKSTDGIVGARAWAKNNFNIGQFLTESGSYNRFAYEEMVKGPQNGQPPQQG